MLVIVRHGRTEANAEGLLLGRADPPLDATGRNQALALAEALRSTGTRVRVVASPLTRARETAAAVAMAFGSEVEVDERWVELDYGAYDGRPASEVPGEVWARWRADADFAPPGGESLRALRTRVEEASEHWCGVAAEEPVVVVTHVSPIKAVLGWVLGVGDEVNWRSWVAPASITRVRPGPGGPVLVSFNDVAHLELPPSPLL